MKGGSSLLLFLSLCTLSVLAEDELIFVFEYSVSGASYPKQDVLSWTHNKGQQLTSAGVRHHYILGRELRKRYMEDRKLLDDKYNSIQIYARAPVIDRAVASAYAQLAGLFVPGSGDIIRSDSARDRATPPNPADYSSWIQDLGTGALNYTYQSLPLVMVGGVPDTLMNPEEGCGSVNSLHLIYTGDHADGWKQQYKSVIDQLAVAVKIDPTNVTNITYAMELRDVVVSSLYQGKPVLEEKATLKLISDTVDMARCARYNYFLDVLYDGSSVSKIMASQLLSSLREKLTEAVQVHIQQGTKKEQLKFAMHVGEAALMEALIRQFGINDDMRLASPASTVFFELYKNASSRNNTPAAYYLKVAYNTLPTQQFSFAEFEDRVKNGSYTAEEFEGRCKSYSRPDDGKGGVNWMLIGIIGGAVVGLGLIGVLVFVLKTKCKGSGDDTDEDDKILKQIKEQYHVADEDDSKPKKKAEGDS